MSEIPAYVSRARLIHELDICDRTLDNWIAKGFPRAGRNGKWKWATVESYMDGPKEGGVASQRAADPEAALREMIDNGHKTHLAKHGGHILGGARRVRGEPELH